MSIKEHNELLAAIARIETLEAFQMEQGKVLEQLISEFREVQTLLRNIVREAAVKR